MSGNLKFENYTNEDLLQSKEKNIDLNIKKNYILKLYLFLRL